jgi:hypothetical protein
MRVNKNQSDKLIIVGMGLAGLTAAIKLALQGEKNIVVFEKREHFSRLQKVLLDTDSEKFITSLVCKSKYKDLQKDMAQKDIAFHRYLKKNKNKIEVYKIQDFLKRKLYDIAEEDQIQVKQGGDVSIESIDMNNRKVYFSEKGDKKMMSFNHLVAADGARHAVCNLLRAHNSNCDINYEKPEDMQIMHKACGAISLKLKDGNEPPEILKEKDIVNLENLEKLKKLDWERPFFPRSYIWPNDDNTKFYLGGEIPESILKLNDKERTEKLEKWGKLLINLSYGISEDQIGIYKSESENPKAIEMNKLKATAFSLDLEYADKNSIRINNSENSISLLGDAARNANFFLTHGANDAISDGIEYAKNINKGRFDIDSFREIHRNKMRGIIDRRMLVGLGNLQKQETLVKEYEGKIQKNVKSILAFSRVDQESLDLMLKDKQYDKLYTLCLDLCQNEYNPKIKESMQKLNLSMEAKDKLNKMHSVLSEKTSLLKKDVENHKNLLETQKYRKSNLRKVVQRSKNFPQKQHTL